VFQVAYPTADRLSHIDRRTGERVRRYDHERPGALLHVDVEKLGQGQEGGRRVHGRSGTVRGRGNGSDYVRVAVDDHPGRPTA
jgi:hypothetical protein